MKTLYCSSSENIGQVKIENAESEIFRLNNDPFVVNSEYPKTWRADFSDFLYCWDETDIEVSNPTKLLSGYCWITCVPIA